MNGVFFTGSDTGVGKTHLLAVLCRVAVARGYAFKVRKPVESGVTHEKESDAARLHHAAASQEPLQTICPYPFPDPIAPPLAARNAGRRLMLNDLVTAVGKHHVPVWVEGAGGLLSPIAEDGLNADLAARLQLPVVIVVPHRLGCINQALLTIEAVRARGLDCKMVVLNRMVSGDISGQDARQIQRWGSCEVMTCPFGDDGGDITAAIEQLLDSIMLIS